MVGYQKQKTKIRMTVVALFFYDENYVSRCERGRGGGGGGGGLSAEILKCALSSLQRNPTV